VTNSALAVNLVISLTLPGLPTRPLCTGAPTAPRRAAASVACQPVNSGVTFAGFAWTKTPERAIFAHAASAITVFTDTL
jgi:hypothetical protein